MAKRKIKKNVLEKRFRDKLKDLMRKSGTKNRELAECLSRFRKPGEKVPTDAYISQLKSGERGVSMDRACIIARFFGIDPSEMFQREPKRKELRIIYERTPQDKINQLRGSELETHILEKLKDTVVEELRIDI